MEVWKVRRWENRNECFTYFSIWEGKEKTLLLPHKTIFAIQHLFQKRHPCLQCFERFSTKDSLLTHLKKCSIPQAVYPAKGSLIYYDKKSEAKYASTLACVAFADFETRL